MTYYAEDLARYIVSKCIAEDHPITNIQLQRILYIIQKDFLSQGKLAIYDSFEAWLCGPALVNVYYDYCGFGADEIFVCEKSFEVEPDDKADIDRVVEIARTLTPAEISAIVHDKAWEKIYANRIGSRGIIPLHMIAECSHPFCKTPFFSLASSG